MQSPCASRMCQLHRKAALIGQIQLTVEHPALILPGRKVIVIVQPDLAPQAATGILNVLLQRLLGLRTIAARIVRMHANGGIEKVVLPTRSNTFS